MEVDRRLCYGSAGMDPVSTDAFELGRGPSAVLLLHGFGGTPFELRPLGERLAARGFHCVGPLLPGHGRGASALGTVDERDWLAAAQAAIDGLRRTGSGPVFAVGFSMGGALAIRLAATMPEDLDGLVLLAPALALRGSSRIFRALFRHGLAARLCPRVNKGPPDIRDRSAPRQGRTELPTRAAAPLDRVIRGARAALPDVRAPALVLWGAHDKVVPRAAAELASRGLGSGPARLVVLPRSAHQLARDLDREVVAREVGDFLEGLVAARRAEEKVRPAPIEGEEGQPAAKGRGGG